jgi:uncharacterized membrane protein
MASLERLAALSDGIFAVAMTLLVLDLRVPAREAAHGEHPLWSSGSLGSERVPWDALTHLGAHLLPYTMSFLTLGIFWLAQQTQLNHFERADRHLAWIHLAFLALVTLMPFSTGFVAEYATYRVPFVVYWLNLVLLGGLLAASLRYAGSAGLFKPDASTEVRDAMRRRIVFYQIWYFVALALCGFNTYAAMVALVLLQLMSALALPVRPFNRF